MTFHEGPMSRLPGRLVGGAALTGADALMVVVFPADRNLWTNPGSRRFRSSGVDQKGAFTLGALPSGDYCLAAIEDRFVVHGSQAERTPQDYRRYLMNCYREAFRLSGTPVRVDFRSEKNPFAGRRDKLTPRQRRTKERDRRRQG
jgi:hypothetical protein